MLKHKKVVTSAVNNKKDDSDYPKKLKFVSDDTIIEFKQIVENNTRDDDGEYVYLDNGVKRIGLVTGEEYFSIKTGKSIFLSKTRVKEMLRKCIVQIVN
jgi:hypothetical protein